MVGISKNQTKFCISKPKTLWYIKFIFIPNSKDFINLYFVHTEHNLFFRQLIDM